MAIDLDTVIRADQARRRRAARNRADIAEMQNRFFVQPDPGANVLGFNIGGEVGDFLLGAGEFASDRVPSIRSDIRAPDTLAADVGRAAFPTAASFLIPAAASAGGFTGGGLASLAGQATLQAGLEAADPTATGKDIAAAGGLALGGDIAGRVLGRVVTGSRAAMQATRGNAIARTQSERLRTVAETLGGGRILGRANQRIVNRDWARAIGQEGDLVTKQMRQEAFETITKGMDDVLPTGTVDVTDAFVILDDLDNFPGKARLLDKIARAEMTPRAWQDAMRTMRDTMRKVSQSPDQLLAGEINAAFDALSEAGIEAGANKQISRVLREKYKNLMLLESMPALRRTGDVPVFSAETKIFNSFGNRVGRGDVNRLLKPTQRAFIRTQELAEDLAKRERSSGTAQRNVVAEAAQETASVISGAQQPGVLTGTLGAISAGPALSIAAVGQATPRVGAAGIAGTQLLRVSREERQRQNRERKARESAR